MLDIQSFLKAQKAMWVKRLLEPEKGNWKALPNLYLKDLLGLDTFKCNRSCINKPENFPSFIWQVLKKWFEIKKINHKVNTAMDIRREILWLNNKVKINNRGLNWKKWQTQGINQIHDIINEHGFFLTLNEIKKKYKITCDNLKYNTLKDAIPNEWRKS